MSDLWVRQVWKHSRTRHVSKLILLFLAHKATDAGIVPRTCVAELGFAAGVTRPTVLRQLRHLCDIGEVEAPQLGKQRHFQVILTFGEIYAAQRVQDAAPGKRQGIG